MAVRLMAATATRLSSAGLDDARRGRIRRRPLHCGLEERESSPTHTGPAQHSHHHSRRHRSRLQIFKHHPTRLLGFDLRQQQTCLSLVRQSYSDQPPGSRRYRHWNRERRRYDTEARPADSPALSVHVRAQGPGTAASTVTLRHSVPRSVCSTASIILRSDVSGAYDSEAYDIVGPTGTSLGYKTVAAKAGDSLILFGGGFVPTNPSVPAGQAYSGTAPTMNSVQLPINNVPVIPAFSGITSAGLYQMKVVPLPAGLGVGDVPLVATVGGVKTPLGVVLSLQ
jgi:uncharacterized protein (TIGR03437 family)